MSKELYREEKSTPAIFSIMNIRELIQIYIYIYKLINV